LAVDVALLERHPLAGPQTDRGREEDRRPVARPEPRGDRVELSPWLERSLLGAPTLRVVDSLLGGLESIIPQTTARASTCRSAWVASKRWPGEIGIRQAAISCE
jgi:hypothetical protein